MNRYTQLPALPKVHFRSESDRYGALCKTKKPTLLEDRREKVTCKKCLEALKKR